MPMTCNLSDNERVARIVTGIILLLGALFNAGRGFLLIVAIIYFVEGYLGVCGIPRLVERFKLERMFKNRQP